GERRREQARYGDVERDESDTRGVERPAEARPPDGPVEERVEPGGQRVLPAIGDQRPPRQFDLAPGEGRDLGEEKDAEEARCSQRRTRFNLLSRSHEMITPVPRRRQIQSW